MKALEEIKDSFESTNVRGDKINILAYHPEQKFPIIAEYLADGGWHIDSFTEEGQRYLGKDKKCSQDLVPKKVDIDYSKLPKDVLCDVVLLRGGAPILRYSDGNGRFYQDGKTSKTCNPSHKTMEYFFGTKVVENDPVAWFGGECPIPKGVKFQVWLRDGTALDGDFDLCWTWSRNTAREFNTRDIVSYQILGEL